MRASEYYSDINDSTAFDRGSDVSPGNPGPFLPPAAGTGPQIEAARDVWRGLKQDFEVCQATDKALIAQLVEYGPDGKLPSWRSYNTLYLILSSFSFTFLFLVVKGIQAFRKKAAQSKEEDHKKEVLGMEETQKLQVELYGAKTLKRLSQMDPSALAHMETSATTPALPE